jgi:hypothetical protein
MRRQLKGIYDVRKGFYTLRKIISLRRNGLACGGKLRCF